MVWPGRGADAERQTRLIDMSRIPKRVILPLAAVVILLIGGVGVFGLPGRGGRASRPGPGVETQSPTSTTGPVAVPRSLSGGLSPRNLPQAPWVVAENARPGDSGWRLARPSRRGAIEGYAGAVSATRGQTVSFYVSTTASTFQVFGYRMGYYGGAGGRLVWNSPRVAGTVQPPPTRDPATNMIETAWSASLSVRVDPSWPPGDYLFKLVADTAWDSYIPLTVRDDASRAAIVAQNSVNTWQAYNLWGGYDLYEGPSGAGGRSKVVSFDRPYRIGDGAGDFLGNEFPFVSLVEGLGLDVTYWTDVDLHEHPELLLHHRALISLGHDEYWSRSMRAGVEAARDQGVNLAFLGANAIFRHIRLEPSPLGADRHEVNYRIARNDPLYGRDNGDVTVSWRDAPTRRPENNVLGELYDCNPVKADLVVTDAGAWVFAGTGLRAGDRIGGIVGSEYDHFDPRLPGPANVEILAHSPVTCRNRPSYSDLTYYSAPSGAGVIDTGTGLWVPFLSDPNGQPALIRITDNILVAFAAGPAGRQHPSVRNWQTLSGH